jgi:hypothetical protein
MGTLAGRKASELRIPFEPLQLLRKRMRRGVDSAGDHRIAVLKLFGFGVGLLDQLFGTGEISMLAQTLAKLAFH